MRYSEVIDLASEPEMPAKTDSYQPVGNADLIGIVQRIGSEHFGKTPTEYHATLGAKGQQMFGYMTFANGAKDMQMSIGFRNSYDKSLAVGLVAGAQIIVCSNLMFVGDIVTVRKHTSNVREELVEIVEDFCKIVEPNYHEVQEKKNLMLETEVSKTFGSHVLGEMFVMEDILTTPMLNIAKKEWLSSPHEEFQGENAWSLFNSCTEALKKAPPAKVMNHYRDLDKFFTSKFELS